MDDKTGYQKFLKELNTSSCGMDVISKYLRTGLFDSSKRTYQKKDSVDVASACLRTENLPFNCDDSNPFSDMTSQSFVDKRASFQKVTNYNDSTYDDTKNPFNVSMNPFDE
ncbi:hypothetical protein DICVIV_12839 [Dictyocaulus viviparus]|uniref:Uncharacterized protein n=1 Tax=Dictyocaulus viviparus TaxID=29172 RepID=A0A0D8XFR2_DICVI|nr:hypothetical protein DICVIV_12839 [Dictyocaulus viviparus]